MKVCNTKKAIAAQLGSYAGLHALMRGRRSYYVSHYTPGQWDVRLKEFVVLGRYLTDQFGQCRKLNREIFTDEDRAKMPAVMTKREYDRFFERRILPRLKGITYSKEEGGLGAFPPPHVVCARCGGSWDLENAVHIEILGGPEQYALESFVGKTLAEVKTEFANRSDAERVINDPAVWNQAWADATIDEDCRATPEEIGWRDKSWDYVVGEGDQADVMCTYFYHGDCFKQHQAGQAVEQAADQLRGFQLAFTEAGFDDVRVTLSPLPAHIMAWIGVDHDPTEEGESVPEIAGAFKYYRVETKQGSFGVLIGVYPLLDIGGTGLALKDLEPEYATQVPPEMQWAAPFTGEIEPLLRLQTLLLKAKLAQ